MPANDGPFKGAVTDRIVVAANKRQPNVQLPKDENIPFQSRARQ